MILGRLVKLTFHRTHDKRDSPVRNQFDDLNISLGWQTKVPGLYLLLQPNPSRRALTVKKNHVKVVQTQKD